MLEFKSISNNDISILQNYFTREQELSCDYSVGGVVMWTEYFKYEYCIFDSTLFIKGNAPEIPKKTSFYAPVGKLCLETTIPILQNHCRENQINLILSPVPDYKTEYIKTIYTNIKTFPLENWKDYLHLAKSLASLQGNKYAKKRNHVNRFRKVYPGYTYKSIDTGDLQPITIFLNDFIKKSKNKEFQAYENAMVSNILQNYLLYNFVGGVIYIDDIVKGICIGEIISNVVFVHIEKADTSIEGCYQALSCLFSQDVINIHPEVKWVNREEDMGDPDLKKAKMSYHPDNFVQKYSIFF